mgnify:CR=1 FL=1
MIVLPIHLGRKAEVNDSQNCDIHPPNVLYMP